jgi:hypothetical protein
MMSQHQYSVVSSQKAAREIAAAAALKSDKCMCGCVKRTGLAVCRKCWDRLPLRYHDGLTRRYIEQFAPAYEGAARWLRSEGIGA